MRDPERIDRVLHELEVFWKRNPDFRLTQIMCVFVPKIAAPQLYYIEDDYIEKILKAKNDKDTTPSSSKE